MAVHNYYAAVRIAQDVDLQQRYFDPAEEAQRLAAIVDLSPKKVTHFSPQIVARPKGASSPTRLGEGRGSLRRALSEFSAERREAHRQEGRRILLSRGQWVGATGTRRFGAEFRTEAPKSTWEDLPAYRYLDPRINNAAPRQFIVEQKTTPEHIQRARRRATSGSGCYQVSGSKAESTPPNSLPSRDARRRSASDHSMRSDGDLPYIELLSPSRFLVSGSTSRFDETSTPQRIASSAEGQVSWSPVGASLLHGGSPLRAMSSVSDPIQEWRGGTASGNSVSEHVRNRAWSEPGSPFAISNWETVMRKAPATKYASMVYQSSPRRSSPRRQGAPGLDPAPPPPSLPFARDQPVVSSSPTREGSAPSRKSSNQHVSFSTSVHVSSHML